MTSLHRLQTENNSEYMDGIFDEFEGKEYYEQPHKLSPRSQGIVMHTILEKQSVILNTTETNYTEETPLFVQNIPPIIYSEMINNIPLRGNDLFDGERDSIVLGYNLSNDGFNTTWTWVYPTVEDATYPQVNIVDLYSPTFNKAVYIQSQLLAAEHEGKPYPIAQIANILQINPALIEDTIRQGPWRFTGEDYIEMIETGEPIRALLKLLLTPATIPGENLHGRYNKDYSTAKVRTAFMSAVSGVIQEFSYLDRYTHEFIDWNNQVEDTNKIFRTRFSLLCLDAYLIKFIEMAQNNTVRRQHS